MSKHNCLIWGYFTAAHLSGNGSGEGAAWTSGPAAESCCSEEFDVPQLSPVWGTAHGVEGLFQVLPLAGDNGISSGEIIFLCYCKKSAEGSILM